MSTARIGQPSEGLAFEYEFCEPPHKIWRAISVPELRERWLPQAALSDPEPIEVTPGREVRYRMRDSAPPFLESTVTFAIEPNEDGGTRLRIIHELTDPRFAAATTRAANNNGSAVLLAA